jgi:hypothetical protein
MEEIIRAAVAAYRNGEEEPLAALLELEADIVPAMAELFRAEAEPDVRAFLVRVAWERHEPTSVDFIVDALSDASEEVWQSALGGTVALASPEILEVLHAAKMQERADAAMTRRFQMCVDEAILYVEGLVRAGNYR